MEGESCNVFTLSLRHNIAKRHKKYVWPYFHCFDCLDLIKQIQNNMATANKVLPICCDRHWHMHLPIEFIIFFYI